MPHNHAPCRIDHLEELGERKRKNRLLFPKQDSSLTRDHSAFSFSAAPTVPPPPPKIPEKTAGVPPFWYLCARFSAIRRAAERHSPSEFRSARLPYTKHKTASRETTTERRGNGKYPVQHPGGYAVVRDCLNNNGNGRASKLLSVAGSGARGHLVFRRPETDDAIAPPVNKRAAAMAGRQPRKTNFAPEEVKVLVKLIRKNAKHLLGKWPNKKQLQKRRKVWSQVLEAVNAVGVETRTLQEIKSKWKKCKTTLIKDYEDDSEEERLCE